MRANSWLNENITIRARWENREKRFFLFFPFLRVEGGKEKHASGANFSYYVFGTCYTHIVHATHLSSTNIEYFVFLLFFIFRKRKLILPKPFYDDEYVEPRTFIVQIASSWDNVCIDSPGRPEDVHKPVGLWPCHKQGGNQVIRAQTFYRKWFSQKYPT